MKKIIKIFLLLFSAMFFLAGCSGKTSNTQNREKTIKFVKSTKEHVWFEVDADAMNNYGKTTIPKAIIITKNGYATYYNTNIDYYDENYSDTKFLDKYKPKEIGEYSKMSINEIKKAAEKADYWVYECDKSAIENGSTEELEDKNKLLGSYESAPTKKMKVSYTTDKTGNNIASENVILPGAARVGHNSVKGDDDDLNAKYKEIVFTSTISSPFTIYNNKYIGYEYYYVSSTGSVTHNYYLTKRMFKNQKISFDK
ncbi:hypothetical protein LB941_09385 [Ligilactobacillus sp. WILCCON 0076]|uniref:Lipoprotein n=1 Tax=Ligilactobacillus ubinensis TaxID=2876789 RepID=A0A9X2FLQ8_9LACO|nr:hypothetical protein [Ligilactobacillus ubinensis]MCP0887544.1 hypothetical protein [Ligilactobacillus ubinensis]